MRLALFSLFLTALHPLLAASFEGVVSATDADNGVMSVDLGKNREIRGKAGVGDLAIYTVGDQIRGKSVQSDGVTLLENIWPANKTSLNIMRAENQRLRRDTVQRGRKVFRSIGEKLPRFALWDQNGQLFQSDSLNGKVAVINFIFTRCTSPNMCPAATMRMSQLQDQVREAGITNVHFVSITLDPDYDTPGVFNAYARSYGIENDNFSFLGGDAQAVEDLKLQLGILAEEDPTYIVNHTMRTIVADPTGKIVYQVPGSGWDKDDFFKHIKTAAGN